MPKSWPLTVDAMDNDEFFIGLQQHFTDAEIVELGIVIGYDIAFGRLLRVFDADPKVCEDPGASGRLV